jgi:5'-nucleotidase
MTPRWIFFDVGNVLLDEDPLTFLSFRRHVEAVQRVRPDLSFADVLALREARAKAGSRWPVYEAVSAFLDDSQCAEVWTTTEREVRARFAELSPPITGAAEVVARLARRFRLGLIANQGRECRLHLEALGLLGHFEVVVFGEDLGRSKPDPDLFRHALEWAGAPASECVMIGDRIDNDVVPAAALGLATVWVRWPVRSAKGWRPEEPEAVAYLASLERTASGADAVASHGRPTRIVDQTRELDTAVLAAIPS